MRGNAGAIRSLLLHMTIALASGYVAVQRNPRALLFSRFGMQRHRLMSAANDYITRFPIYKHLRSADPPQVYLDHAATSHPPLEVIEAMSNYYKFQHSNVHRAGYALAVNATRTFENARQTVRSFFGATAPSYEVVFTRGATDSLNIVAHGLASTLKPGDEILLTVMEHHSNILPWQEVARKTGAILRYVGLDDAEALNMEELRVSINERTKVVAVTHASNVLGCINPIAAIAQLAHNVGAVVVVDASQTAAHIEIDMQALGCDFLVASAHKMYGPTGIGALCAKTHLLEHMPPLATGGGMVDWVEEDKATFSAVPQKFEAGTPPTAEAVGFAAACDFVRAVGFEHIQATEQRLVEYLWDKLKEIPRLRLYGPSPRVAKRVPLVAFNVEGVHPSDIAVPLHQAGVCIRTGSHCAGLLHQRFGVSASLRASLSFVTPQDDIDRLASVLRELVPRTTRAT